MTRTALRGWGRAVASAADVVRPPADVALRLPNHPRGILGRGMARSYGDAAQNAGGVVLDMTARRRLRGLDLDRGRARVDAGITLDELLRAIVPLGWFLPVTPGTRMITVGGAIAADVHGKNHVAAGSFRHHLRGFSLLLADGSQRWVTPADGDVFDATVGGMGLTGVVLDAELDLTPVATSVMRVTRRTAPDLDATLDALERSTAEHRVATVDLMTPGRIGRSIVETADHAPAGDLDGRRAGTAPLAYRPTRRATVPDVVPDGLLNRVTGTVFTALWFARAPRRPRSHLVDLAGFFYPLDALAGWNRLYGRRGFVQYQFAVPLGREDTLRRIAHRFADTRCPTFVVVLKRLGPGAGMLSFPIEGWTLAADIPAGVADLGVLLDGCDDLVCEAGGRVYLAKDGRLRAARMPVMYPDLARWRTIRDGLDPQGRWRSDLGRRLGLCST